MNRTAKRALVLALVVVVGMAFRVSWNALRDIAKAIGADDAAANLYPFVVDGLMALTLVATLVLTGDARRFALRVLAAYTLASLVLNYVHGLVPALHSETVDWGRLADWDPANWALVLLATSLPVGSIYFGSDLVAEVLHHRPAIEPDKQESIHTPAYRSTPEQGEPPAEQPEPQEEVDSSTVAPIETIEARPQLAVAAEVTRPRRATGRVPAAARSTRPTRTEVELLAEARSLTESWPIEKLTGEGIRKALRTSPAKARIVRETLKAERERDSAAAVAG
ncbi:hypothetical protein Snoj_59160 [Streptomyces nojiriensis]|uniref:DUF2637 domain-containing protein n=1 Tax=Streptomyces nojiriensis TaxID=66374 RepID=A0ABQ3SV26_9ACTN|nr:DUF2637 domain-containing protein [Streptomyces nojiriensis]QTI45534.1 hypothetical protein JYK04_03327 [Streptomyces nojiriensis]GGR96583.1 hypothetical protein GCM10010205_26700 [Streptomyces nojiriensis]GHI71998.1 hypothetical protein Snoj_59160 [Streptomyces nojiriensis]